MAKSHGTIFPLYQKVKKYILQGIEDGTWGPSERVPSESELVKLMGVSRMTANRALRELMDDGYLIRMAGVGTFVAEIKAESHFLEIRDIADEIRERGHQYTAEVVKCKEIYLSARLAKKMGVAIDEPIYHSIIKHKELGITIQLDDRFVSPKVAPDYINVDFTQITPTQYLSQIAPLQIVEHTIEAVNPSKKIRELMGLSGDEVALLLQRRTWTDNLVTSFADLYYPGSRYRLRDRFDPKKVGLR